MANPLIGQGFIRDRKGGAPVEIVDLEARQRIAALEENEGSGPIELPDNYVTTDTEQTLTAKKVIPQIETGNLATSYFQTQKMRGEGDASSYYHAIDFGYANHDRVDFYEYGGVWNFWKNTSATATTNLAYLALGVTLDAVKNKNFTYTFPNKNGTFALTSDIPNAITESDVTDWGFAKTSDIPDAVTESTVSGWGFAKSTDVPTDEHINGLIDAKNKIVEVLDNNTGSSFYAPSEIVSLVNQGCIITFNGTPVTPLILDSSVASFIVPPNIIVKIGLNKTFEFEEYKFGVSEDEVNNLIDAKIPDPVTDEHINSLISEYLDSMDGSGVAF